MPSSISEIPVDLRLQRASTGRRLISVEAPSRLLYDANPPVHRDIEHSLLRPFQRVIQRGNPIVGTVQYNLLQLPGERWPRVLFAVAARENASQEASLLPCNLFIFQGIRSKKILSRGGDNLQVHHLSIRETDKPEIWAYSHAEPVGANDDRGPLREERGETLEWNASIVQVAQFFVKDRTVMDRAGLALARLSPGAERSMEARGELLPDPFAANHVLTRPQFDDELLEHPHFLWCGLFLAEEPPSAQEQMAIMNFFHRRGFHEDLNNINPVSIGLERIHVGGNALDLEAIGRSAKFRYLVSLTAIVPGRLRTDTGIACFASELPLRRMYQL